MTTLNRWERKIMRGEENKGESAAKKKVREEEIERKSRLKKV